MPTLPRPDTDTSRRGHRLAALVRGRSIKRLVKRGSPKVRPTNPPTTTATDNPTMIITPTTQRTRDRDLASPAAGLTNEVRRRWARATAAVERIAIRGQLGPVSDRETGRRTGGRI